MGLPGVWAGVCNAPSWLLREKRCEDAADTELAKSDVIQTELAVCFWVLGLPLFENICPANSQQQHLYMYVLYINIQEKPQAEFDKQKNCTSIASSDSVDISTCILEPHWVIAKHFQVSTP